MITLKTELRRRLLDIDMPGMDGLEQHAASADGSMISEIAAGLYLSEGTVRNYLSACIQQTGARNRTEALGIAQERGWLGL